MTGKQRAYLRSMCNTLPAIILVGKEGVTDSLTHSVEEALLARELIKMGVQRGSPLPAREACTELCERTGAEPVQCIGNKFCIYKPREEDPEIVLPKA